MKIPDSFNKVTPLSKTIALILFFLLPIMGFYYGRYYQHIAEIKTYVQSNRDVVLPTPMDRPLPIQLPAQIFEVPTQSVPTEVSNQDTNEVAQLKEDLDLTIQDRAKFISSKQGMYDYVDFGIYSPFFEGRTVTTETYKYKLTTITLKHLEMVAQGVIINVWHFNDYNKPNFYPDQQMAIFSGYENNALRALHLSDIEKQWKDSYIASNTTYHWDYGDAPHYIGSVGLQAYIENSASGHPIFIEMYKILHGMIVKETDPLVTQTKLTLQKVVDSILYRKPN